MVRFFKQHHIFLIVSLFIIFVFFFYLFFGNQFLDDYIDRKQENIILHSFENSDVIQINNTVPINDVVGKSMECAEKLDSSQRCFDFSLESTVSKEVKYRLYLVKNDVSPEIKNDYIKLYLTSGKSGQPKPSYDTNIIPSYASLKSVGDDSSIKLLYSGTLDPKVTEKFQLRIWLADTYVMQREAETFSARLKVVVY